MKIGVVVTNYNSWKIAKECVLAHLKYAGDSIEKIVLVDDCSTETIEEFTHPKFEIVRNPVNMGFVKSVNVGFRNINTDIVLLFDADAKPLMDYSSIIKKEFSENPELGIVGFSTFNENNVITGSSEKEPGALSLLLGQKLYHHYQGYFYKKSENINVYSCTMAVRKAAFDSVGGFDENFDWLDPDNDFCMSVRKKGWKIKLSSELKAYHEGGGTPQKVSHRVLRFYKNRWYLLKKHNKIKFPALIKQLIISRLKMEYLFLKLLGKQFFKDPAVYLDKLEGRKKIIDFCKENY